MGKVVWIDRLAPCLDRPGEWVEVYRPKWENTAEVKKRLTTRVYRIPVPDGQWEFRGTAHLSVAGDVSAWSSKRRGLIEARFLGPG